MALTQQEIQEQAQAIMPSLVEELKVLVSHASCAFPEPEYPVEPVDDMRAAVIELLKRSGVPNARELDLGAGTPSVYATVDGDPEAPTVLLYAHYDIQPAPADQWDTDPFVATVKDDGRMYGRGVADDKSGIIIHAGALQVLAGRSRINLKILIEGEEETVGHLEEFIEKNPELFTADIYMIADMGNMVVGEPALTATLRGNATGMVTVRSLSHPNHSGLFGGGAPDAGMALVRMLASLQDDRGNVLVPGLHRYEWDGIAIDEQMFMSTAGMLGGTELIGDGSLATRVWSSPSISAIGIDTVPIAEAANVVIPEARAKISMRVAPGGDADEELKKLFNYLQEGAPWGVEVECEKVRVGEPFVADFSGPAVATALSAMTDAFGTPAGIMGGGGSIPLVATLAAISPDAEMIIYGAEDFELANIHSPNESVDLAEIERVIVAEALMLDRFA